MASSEVRAASLAQAIAPPLGTRHGGWPGSNLLAGVRP